MSKFHFLSTFLIFSFRFFSWVSLLQKQPFRGVRRKLCSENMPQIYRRTPMPKCDFNKVAKQSNVIEIALRHGCSRANLLHIFRKPFPKNSSGGLLLVLQTFVSQTLIQWKYKWRVHVQAVFLRCYYNDLPHRRFSSLVLLTFIKITRHDNYKTFNPLMPGGNKKVTHV